MIQKKQAEQMAMQAQAQMGMQQQGQSVPQEALANQMMPQ
jgi:hypothetical protein